MPYPAVMYTRREFTKIALAGVPAAAALGANRIDSTIRGVQIGVQTYSFRDRPLDGVIKAMVELGLGDCEVYSPHVEPKLDREALRQWRLTVSLDEMKAARKKF